MEIARWIYEFAGLMWRQKKKLLKLHWFTKLYQVLTRPTFSKVDSYVVQLKQKF